MSLSHSSARPAALRARRRPRQARSQVTVSAILEAAARVLLKHGYQGCTTKEVAEIAGVGIGSLYEYFPNKEALIAAVVEREAERHMDVLKDEILATLDRPFVEALRTALRGAMRELERRPLLSLLFREYPYIGQLTILRTLPVRAAELAAFCLRRWGDEFRVRDSASYQVLTNMLMGAYFSRVVAPHGQLSNEDFLNTVEAILLKVLEPQPLAAHSAA
ncbi:MAG TPA: TetR/AcrR family transcriptional regulator [Polyangiales bacterium]